MSTRSVVARTTGEGFKGRYVHSDGYATYMGPTLFALFNRTFMGDAADMMRVLNDEHYGWSSLSVDCGQPESWAVQQYGTERVGGHSDGRFAQVDRVGVAYTTEHGQSSPDEWETHEDAANTWCEWAWAIDVDSNTLTSFVIDGNVWRPVWIGRLDGPEPDWERIETSAYEEA